MIKCYILDDEANCIIALKQMLGKYHPEVEVIGESTSTAEAEAFLSQKEGRPDILFLDIQMPGEDGFSFLSRFSDANFSVIFTTAYDTYAIKAIRFSALDYLLKPINKDELKEAIGKFKNKPGKDLHLAEFKTNIKTGTYFDKLGIPTQTEIYFIRMENILYLESDNNYTKIYTSSGSPIMSSKNIGYYEELLDGLNFFRIHNSYIINLKKIVRYVRGKSGSVELENGVNLEISKRKKEQFLKFLDLV